MAKIEDILEIMENGAELTEEQLALLESDADFRTAAEDILAAQRVLGSAPDSNEVEERLRAFHQKHAEEEKTEANVHAAKERSLWQYMWKSITVAAVFLGVLWAISLPEKKDDSMIFVAEKIKATTITDADGNTIPMIAKKEKNSVDPVIVADKCIDVSSAVGDTLMLTLSHGQSYRVDLADGTKVYLHPGSRLQYPKTFGMNTRDVRLEGEGYFVVAKDKSRPFRVITNRSVTSVLGTEFNLRASGKAAEQLVLVNGKVDFMNIANGRPVRVHPGEEVVLDEGGRLDVHQTDTIQYTSWRDGFIYYDRSQLSEILQQIGSTYNVSVQCTNQELLDLHMHFVLRRDQNIHDAIRMLNSMKKVNATLQGDVLVVKRMENLTNGK